MVDRQIVMEETKEVSVIHKIIQKEIKWTGLEELANEFTRIFDYPNEGAL